MKNSENGLAKFLSWCYVAYFYSFVIISFVIEVFYYSPRTSEFDGMLLGFLYFPFLAFIFVVLPFFDLEIALLISTFLFSSFAVFLLVKVIKMKWRYVSIFIAILVISIAIYCFDQFVNSAEIVNWLKGPIIG